MRNVLKWIGIILGSLIGILVVTVIGLYLSARGRLNKTYTVNPGEIAIPTDEASLARGEHLVNSVSGCIDCHGPDLGGALFLDDPSIGVVYAPNLTAGQGGRGATHTSEDWVRAIQHGITAQGKPVLIMPSQFFNAYDDEDLGAIIAYIKSVPPVNHETPPKKLTFPAHLFFALGFFGDLPAEMIDHEAAASPSPEPAVTVEYGEFLSVVGGCRDCHGMELNGGLVGGPGGPFAPNLTPGGSLAGWTEDEFFNTLRTGVRPGGLTLLDDMPWRTIGTWTDDELSALWLYLQSLPALETNIP
jgi:mono/diheme cytochrome c family protein